MKRVMLLCSLVLALSACTTAPPLPQKSREPVRSAPQGKVDLLLAEANRLAGEVKAGKLDRVAAADRLDAYRQKIAGRNALDDASFARYRQIAVEREAGKIGQDDAQARMEGYLREVLRQTARKPAPPTQPVFTDFLLKVYGLPPIAY